ncbi:hybrid sensor histidine kinase/response regulator [Phaeobacter marinintestinus]|uniref:hybrid sensor histidine kinase/response regulator n=1 Tax=Falsiphaeobacter marinintestinus TaxID=1492905 RepID=UPI0011B41240|nr:PAS domain-containing hybrid sensor histidine kinase/response regulator [Phaeobacter marinintestinus]
MKGPWNWQAPRGRSDILLGLLVTLCVTFIIFIAVSFARQTINDMRELETATSDNVQWTLPQIEVEYLVFLNALALQDTSGEPDLDEIRLRYDIFYSRIETLTHSRVFEQLSTHRDFTPSLTEIRSFLTFALPLIDGPDTELSASLPRIRDQARPLRQAVRTLSISGLSFFAAQTDLRRTEVADTLGGLAQVAGFLFLALATLSVFLFMMYRNTETKSLELAQANERMNTILSTSLDGVIVTDTQGNVQEFNAAAEDIFGYSQDQVRGQSVGTLFVPDHLRDAHEAGMLRIRTGGERRVTGKGRVQMDALRADQSSFPIELALQSAFDGRHEIFIGFVRDISERLQSQSDLVEARDHALAGEKAKADFLTVMSHEIRTPLNGLLGNLSLLQDTELTAQQAEFVRNMDISGSILISHVDAVLDLSRLEAGKLAMTQEPANLGDLLQDLIDGQRSIAETHGSVIEWRWVGTPVDWVMTDTTRLTQILLNLIGNAIKFTENGRILIEIEALAPSTSDIASPDLFEFRVSDTGIGIAEDTLEHVFEDFQTSDVSFGRVTSGTGLGLGISRRLVQAMGGEIGVESILGTGSTFWVRLPMDLADAPQTRQTLINTGSGPKALNVLIVEDNEINRQVAQNMLERDGHQVTCTMDGKSGVQAAARSHFDLILMDISMPVMDGLEATRQIRRGDGPSSKSPIIALSANVLPQDQARYSEAGMDAFLSKPLTLKGLRSTLASLKTGKTPPSAPKPNVRILELDQLADMRASLGEDGYFDLLKRFLNEGDALVGRLGSVQADEYDSLSSDCHKAAGSAAVFGADAFRQALLAYQTAAKSRDFQEVHAQASETTAIWAQTRSALCDQS